MLRFDAYRDGVPAPKVGLSGAHLLGEDSVPVRAEISATAGRITCKKRTAGASALALLWDAGPAGRLLLPTTRLPERKAPYNLNVELVRARMMMLIQKREEWGLFDYASGQELTDEFEKARRSFVEVLKAGAEEPGRAALLADACLAEAIALSERTAMFHADAFLSRRKKNGGVGGPVFGCVADLFSSSDDYHSLLAKTFDFLSLPLPWKHTEPREGHAELDRIDAWVDWCRQHRMPIHAGPVVSFEPKFFPEWIYIWEHDFETLRDMIYEHVGLLVKRYAERVRTWNVISAVNAYNCFNLNFEQIMELTRLSCSLVKKLAPECIVLIDLAMPWGEYYAANQRTIPPMMYADMCVQSGVKFDAFGVQMLLGVGAEGMYVRDLMQISTKLDEFAGLGKALHVTACQVPSDMRVDPGDYWQGQVLPDKGGSWRQDWDPQMQAKWLEAFYNLALSKPFVETVCWRDLTDGDNHYLPHGGLCSRDLTPKPAFGALKRIRAAISGSSRPRRGASSSARRAKPPPPQ